MNTQRKIKKYISFTIVFGLILTLCLTFVVSAIAAPKNGDVLGNVLYSDILAYINGQTIPTSIIAGKTLVAVEDLKNYGFDVNWNSRERSLKIELNENKQLNPLKALRDTKSFGTIKEQYFYTDIKTYISGEVVDSYAISGVTLMDFELLAKYGKLTWDGRAREIRLVMFEDYFKNSYEWVNLQDSLNLLVRANRGNDDVRRYFPYDKSRRAVRKAFGYPPGGGPYYFTTAIIDNDENKIYIKRNELERFIANELWIEGFNTYIGVDLDKLDEFYDEVVSISDIYEATGIGFVNYHSEFESTPEYLVKKGLQMAYDYTEERFEVYYDGELQGYISPVRFAPGEVWSLITFIKKEDINYYLKKYGFPEFK